jgi:hypothetical protein
MSLSSRAVAVAASTGCPRLGSAAHLGWSDTKVAKDLGLVAIAPRLAFLEGQEFERRAIGRDSDGDADLLELLGVTGTVVRFKDGEADSELLAEFDAAVADPNVAIIIQGVLPGLYLGYHRPDLMVRNPIGWTVGEVKVYLDRGGDTPVHLVQSTATQAAVSVVAARRHGLTVSETAMVVLASARGLPSVRLIHIGGETDLIEQLTVTSPRPRGEHDYPSTLAHLAGHRYVAAACEGACALADICRKQAGAEPGVLWPGDAVAPTYGWTHEDLLAQCESGVAPPAVQAGWDAAPR